VVLFHHSWKKHSCSTVGCIIGRMNIANIGAICRLHPQTVRDILVHRIDEDSDRARMLGEKGSSWLTCLQELSSEISNGLLAWLPVEVCWVIQKSSQNHTYHSDGVEVLNVGGNFIHCQVWSALEMLSKTPNLVSGVESIHGAFCYSRFISISQTRTWLFQAHSGMRQTLASWWKS
jgi:hypothetical protein